MSCKLASWTSGGICAERYGYENISAIETVPFGSKIPLEIINEIRTIGDDMLIRQ